ncbi:hypothetical protein AB0F49_20545 [Micromonospora ureilytica]|uniref:Rv0361 family membrane protein n=1 Tax=Micromonospora ureilytica TaxID=709868 RepID=UPI0033DDE542
MTDHPDASAEPAPEPPAPTEPAPTEPAPTEPAPTEPAPTVPSRGVRRRVILIAGAAAVVVLAGVAVFVVTVLRQRVDENSDERRITSLVTEFAAAIDTADQPKLAKLLCPEEAATLDDDEVDIHPESNDPIEMPAEHRMRVTTTRVSVTGDTANAQVTVVGQEPVTLHFRKHEKRWVVCDPSAGQPTVSPPPN